MVAPILVRFSLIVALLGSLAGCGSTPNNNGYGQQTYIAPTDVVSSPDNGVADVVAPADTNLADTNVADTATTPDTAVGADTGTPADASAPCNIAFCDFGLAATCPGQGDSMFLNCSKFGGTCAKFQDPTTNSSFGWCNCGSLAEGQSSCIDSTSAVTCSGGLAEFGNCPVGTYCDPSQPQYCTCDGKADGICPDPSCTGDPDCKSCIPACGQHNCGDNGCGGSCGACGMGQQCSGGNCVCAPSCGINKCGSDGCGGSCGTCSGDTTCAGGQCMTICKPACSGKICGPDGCGGSCGACSGSNKCNDAGQCVATCVANCTGKSCGSDGCGGLCGNCPTFQNCVLATGQCQACAPNCTGKACGNDGCGGTCGSCSAPTTCSLDQSQCECDFFATLTYTFDASALDFTNSLTRLFVEAQNIKADGSTDQAKVFIFPDGGLVQTMKVYGCVAKVKVHREYQYKVFTPDDCVIDYETLSGKTTFLMPPADGTTGPGCAPPLQ